MFVKVGQLGGYIVVLPLYQQLTMSCISGVVMSFSVAWPWGWGRGYKPMTNWLLHPPPQKKLSKLLVFVTNSFCPHGKLLALQDDIQLCTWLFYSFNLRWPYLFNRNLEQVLTVDCVTWGEVNGERVPLPLRNFCISGGPQMQYGDTFCQY